MTIDLTPAKLRELAEIDSLPWDDLSDAARTTFFILTSHIASEPDDEAPTLARALADAMERVEQLTNEARLANNAVGSHANEIVMLSAKINDLKTVLKRAYNAMAEPHGDWKDIREAKSLIEIRAMLGGEPT